MVDSGNFGRDHRLLLEQGPRLVAADPEHNVLLSVHRYDPLPEAELAALFARSLAMDLPLLVGEFASVARDVCTPVDYRAIIRQAARHDIGWLAWSWGDDNPADWWNDDHCPDSFDMTTHLLGGHPAQLGEGGGHRQPRQHPPDRPPPPLHGHRPLPLTRVGRRLLAAGAKRRPGRSAPSHNGRDRALRSLPAPQGPRLRRLPR
jgi:hypothetical protein